MKKLLKTLGIVVIGDVVIAGILTILYFASELLKPDASKPICDDDDDNDYLFDDYDLDDLD